MGRYKIIRTYHQLQRLDEDFYDPTNDSLTLIEPKLTLALNENGSLEFTVPRCHKYFNDISPMADEFMVRDEIKDETLFVGRPISCKVLNFDRIEVYCEGAMGYLNDILIRPSIWEAASPEVFFRDVINRYNEIKKTRVPFQTITPGSCTIPAREIYRTANYDKAYDMLQNGCLNSDGGYFMMEYDRNGGKILNWYKDPPARSHKEQAVIYGENIISFEEGLDMSSSPTCMIPLGADTEEDLGGNLGKKKVEQHPVALGVRWDERTGDWEQAYDITWQKFGYIEMKKEYKTAENPTQLMEQINNDPQLSLQYCDWLSYINCTVADLGFIQSGTLYFYLGQKVKFDVPIQIYTRNNDTLYITKMEYSLERALVDITASKPEIRQLSDQFTKPEEEKKETTKKDTGSSEEEYDENGNLIIDKFIIPFPEVDIIEPLTGKLTVLEK